MMMDDYDGQMIFGDLVGLKLPDIHLTDEEKPPKKPHPGNLSRLGIKPRPTAWQARMLPLVPQRWTKWFSVVFRCVPVKQEEWKIYHFVSSLAKVDWKRMVESYFPPRWVLHLFISIPHFEHILYFLRLHYDINGLNCNEGLINIFYLNLGESGKLWQPSDRSVVCSEHFAKEDYREDCKISTVNSRFNRPLFNGLGI